jgi:hypothetical protein
MGDKFEEWIKKQEFSFVYLMRNSPDYKSAVWRAWQASRQSTIEEIGGMVVQFRIDGGGDLRELQTKIKRLKNA